jgi:RimJ/RimL family protein N-acetyltransferase
VYPERIESERMLMSRPLPCDEADLYRLFTDPRVMATLGGMRSADETRSLVDRTIAHWPVHAFGAWIMREKATGAFIGRGGCRLVLIEGVAEIEVAYALLPDYWGRGLATELARISVQTGFDALSAFSLICFTSPTNLASRRVMEKVGFTYERDGEFFGLPQVIYRQHRYV